MTKESESPRLLLSAMFGLTTERLDELKDQMAEQIAKKEDWNEDIDHIRKIAKTQDEAMILSFQLGRFYEGSIGGHLNNNPLASIQRMLESLKE